jgi:hypothetical protein
VTGWFASAPGNFLQIPAASTNLWNGDSGPAQVDLFSVIEIWT